MTFQMNGRAYRGYEPEDLCLSSADRVRASWAMWSWEKLGLAAGGIAFLANGIHEFWASRRRPRGWVKQRGMVVKSIAWERVESYFVRYELDGVTRHFEHRKSHLTPGWNEGQEVSILVDPNDPPDVAIPQKQTTLTFSTRDLGNPGLATIDDVGRDTRVVAVLSVALGMAAVIAAYYR